MLTPHDIRRAKVTNPSAPIFRALPKIHKDGIPIRPLVNFIPAPSYNIAKRIEQVIRQETTLKNSHSLKNSLDLIDKIKTTELKNGYTLASFDVVNLYTNVPVDETIKVLEQNLRDNSNLLPKAIDELIILTRTIIKQNYFQFNNEFYTQNEGLAMGSPLSGILAELFLNDLENKYLWNKDRNKVNKIVDKIIFYHRYVDDTILLFNGNARQLNILNNYLNKIHKNMQFTLEIEENHSINFLDLTITQSDKNLKFKIYRKPTATDLTIHSTSHHPQTQKMAAYNSFVYRLLTVPLSPEDYNKELLVIKQIAMSNGYTSTMVDKLIEKFKRKLECKSHENNKETKTYVSAEFGISTSNKLKNELAKNNTVVSFKTSNKLSSLIKRKNHNTQRKNEEKTGVYKLKCSECPKYYIGQTARSFAQRFKEHLPKKSKEQKSAFASHLIDENHSYEAFDKNLQVINVCKKGKLLNCLEEFNIYKAIKEDKDNVLNEQTSFQSNIIYDRAVEIVNRQAGISCDNR